MSLKDKAKTLEELSVDIAHFKTLEQLTTEKWVPLEEAQKQIEQTITDQRNNWLKSTEKLRKDLHDERCYVKKETRELRQKIAKANQILDEPTPKGFLDKQLQRVREALK